MRPRRQWFAGWHSYVCTTLVRFDDQQEASKCQMKKILKHLFQMSGEDSKGTSAGAKRRARIRERGKKNPLSNVTLYAFKEAVGKVTSYQKYVVFFSARWKVINFSRSAYKQERHSESVLGWVWCVSDGPLTSC